MAENRIAGKRRARNRRTRNGRIAVLFSALLLIGAAVCLICDLAISGMLTWSLIPVSSLAFAWVVCVPGIIWGKRGILVSLLALSVSVIPYLFLLSRLTNVKEVFSIGAATAAVSVVFLWEIAAVFRRVGKTRRGAAWGIVFLSAIPFLFFINGILSEKIAEPLWDVWDTLFALFLFVLAGASFLWEHARGRRRRK